MTTETEESHVQTAESDQRLGAEEHRAGETGQESEPGATDGVQQEKSEEAPTAEQIAELKRTIDTLQSGASTRDEETTRLRTALQRLALEREQAQAELTEHRASLADQKMIDAGEMSEDEARARAERRRESAAAEQEARRRLEQARSAATVFEKRNESAARQQLADSFAEKYGLNSKELLSRPDKGPAEMHVYALETAFERERESRPGTETYETNAGAPPGPPDLSGLSPTRQAVLAYGPEETARRQRDRRR